MRVCITTVTTTDKFTGVAFYLQKLLQGLQEIDKTNEYLIITTKDNYHFFELKNSNFKEVRLPFNQRSFVSRAGLHLFNILFFPFFLLFRKVRVVHYPNTMFVTRPFVKTIITIHDIVDQKVKKYGKARNLYRKFLVNRALKHSNEIITVSENSKKDLFEWYQRDINMIYNGYDPLTISGSEDQAILEKYGVVKENYFIVIGTLLKHKNIPQLIRVFAEYQKIAGSSAINKLLLVGHKENDYENIMQEIQDKGLQERVLILDYIDNRQKQVLLKNAFAFTFFSLYEGFGFPILEAQDLYVPVIILDTSCLREITGESGLVLPNLEDDQKLATLLMKHCRVLKDPGSKTKIVETGKLNISRFQWSECASKTHSLYERYRA